MNKKYEFIRNKMMSFSQDIESMAEKSPGSKQNRVKELIQRVENR